MRALREGQVLSPTREARLFLARLLHTSPSRVYLFWDLDLDERFLRELYAMLEERLRGVPLQYILGEWEFLSLPFQVERGVFIPRFDTESWVEEAVLFLRLLAQRKSDVAICDVGCGSGVIGISCAFWVPGIRVWGVDISEKAVALSRKNAEKLGVMDRVSFFRSDLFEALRGLQIQFDAILSNPPYVPSTEWDLLSREIREYEPREALVAGGDGLKVVWRVIEEGLLFLREGGFFFIEHDPRQVDIIREKVRRNSLLEYLRPITDYNGKIRASVLKKREEETD